MIYKLQKNFFYTSLRLLLDWNVTLSSHLFIIPKLSFHRRLLDVALKFCTFYEICMDLKKKMHDDCSSCELRYVLRLYKIILLIKDNQLYT